MEMSDYLQFMVEHGASDLFFSTNAPVMIKIEGQIHPVQSQHTMAVGEVKTLAYSLMQDHHIQRFEQDWELNFAASIKGLARFRINLLRQRGEVAMVVRHVKTEIPSFAELHLPASLKELVMHRRGLVLVAGATGSGKSTTMAAMLDYRNAHHHSHILTIEDPIEYLHHYKRSIVNQREIGSDTQSYASALKNAMREAPDVILIGEIRDSETMHSAITYAETGHLCLGTIHAANAIETLDRVLNFFPEKQHRQLRTDLSRNLRAIVCQRLLIGLDKKRWPAFEILPESPYISELIQNDKIEEIAEALERGMDIGARNFDDDIFALFQEGKISEEEALSHADSRHNLKVKMRLSQKQETSQSEISNDLDWDHSP
ncbi:PilT/PilU family type 4a pilus ATPase [uncultured Pseudoteredinibacter sp.]|uniref:PilT/PilU family type 4a pilus ATPase n=1 Tax=uncultured Pseudoteredinibacter sp. TaxID=1641701 RepID=UPI002627475D|nr:PilT/PilU family type 4a pilus ATPase [uncultured Pseudoteredinibacter sp.]